MKDGSSGTCKTGFLLRRLSATPPPSIEGRSPHGDLWQSCSMPNARFLVRDLSLWGRWEAIPEEIQRKMHNGGPGDKCGRKNCVNRLGTCGEWPSPPTHTIDLLEEKKEHTPLQGHSVSLTCCSKVFHTCHCWLRQPSYRPNILFIGLAEAVALHRLLPL